ncbi:uncharacterized protein [Apostichopus japonicus]|uniref:uncharacterized protein isoform X2 n=1 Tax=Stichopus japonicus TaxID=307972 RepID=UPI003AB34E76
MAQLPNQQGFPLNYQPVVMVQQQVPQNVGNLKGSGPRRAMGSLIIACGCAQIVFSICLVIVLRPYGLLYGHWGIWNGVVITFMVLAINATLLCVLCCGYQATHAAYFRYYDVGAFVLFTISCLLYGLQLLFCIIGASFTCVALSDGVPQQQLITYPPHAMPPGQAYGASPYTGVVNMAMQPAPVNVGSVNDDPPAYQFAVAQPKI